MQYFDQYLSKHNNKPWILTPPRAGTTIIVVIPCFNEPDIISSLESLWHCDYHGIVVEVIVVVNFADCCDAQTKEFNRHTWSMVSEWAEMHKRDNFICFTILASDLPPRFAGVGLARKIGMDEAVLRFNVLGFENGIICGFDADAKVGQNYLEAISNHFSNNPKSPGASIYFEHQVSEVENERMESGIIQYESHLRYLLQAIRFTGFPNSFHTVGSSFAVRASAYVKQGGMNKFKAGEDFYFLNKIIALGGYTEINDTVVYPQARVSSRVPFGTGASMTRWMEINDTEFLTYQYDSFLPMKTLFDNIAEIYSNRSILGISLNETLTKFLHENGATQAIEEIYSNSSTLASFSKRFYNWFDAFRIVKYLNFAVQNGYTKSPVRTESEKLAKQHGFSFKDNMEMLLFYRNWDRDGLHVLKRISPSQ